MLVVVVAAGLAIGWFSRNAFLRPFSSETLRTRWTADGTLTALKSWTDEVLAGKRSARNWPKTESPFIHMVIVIRDGDQRPTALAFEMGGADNHHGLIIGQRPESFWAPLRSQWDEDVWLRRSSEDG
jgi:hypothetical protein